MSDVNGITILVYKSALAPTTPIVDMPGELRWAENIQWSSHYPGGRYGDASFFIERPVTDPWELRGGQRVTFFNSGIVVYEGFIAAINMIVDEDIEGCEVILSGATDWLLMNYAIEKRWADNRTSPDVWVPQEVSGNTDDLFDISNRGNNVYMSPKNATFADGDYTAVRYTMPVGETVKRLKYTYDFNEVSGAWEISVWRSTDGSSFTQMTSGSGETYTTGTTTVITADGTASIDVTLATPSRYIELRYYAKGANTPTYQDHNYAEWSAIMVYSEIETAITAVTITADIVTAMNTDGYLNSSTLALVSPASPLTLEPFYTQGYPSAADVLNDAWGRGDAVYARYAWIVLDADSSPDPDGKPVLDTGAYPDLSDFGYAIHYGEENIESSVEVTEDFAAIANDIVLSYTDELGVLHYITSDDDANLTDATSVSDYGLHQVRLDCGQTTSAEAIAYGRRFLATYKDPQWRLLSPITISDTIRRKNSGYLPVCQFSAEARLKLENFPTGVGVQDFVFVVTATAYDVDTDQVTITCGVPGAPLGARQVPSLVSAPPDEVWSDGATEASGSGGGGNKQGPKGRDTNWRKRKYVQAYAKAKGIDLSKVPGRSPERDKIVRDAWKNREKKKKK